MVSAALAVIVSGAAIFVAPGAVLLAAAAMPVRRSEQLAFAFAASLALLTATFATCLLLNTSIAAAPLVLAAVTIVAALAARRFVSAEARGRTDVATSSDATGGATSPLTSRVVLVLLAAIVVAAAVVFAPVGSVDRWWYLAYVRGYLDAPVLTLAEPFLGTGREFARFGVHPWLFGLALWSHLCGLDPVVVYERGAPVLVVCASISAARALAGDLFGQGSRARLCVLATMLLWSGSMIPVLARAGEDKVLAASALLPLCAAALLRIARGGPAASGGGHDGGAACRQAPLAADLLLLLVAAVATAAVHALAYAFVLVSLLPTAALLLLRHPSRRRAVGLAVAVLLVVAVAPAISGLVVRERLSDIGAELASPDHPVVRVHEGRERLVDLPVGGYVVSPRLLLHPLALLALAGLPLIGRRRPDRASRPACETGSPAPTTSDPAFVYLAATTAVALAIAFVPPLPAAMGSVIPPWMVYRVLWLLPLAPLAAIAADALAARFARREAAATLVLLLLGLPVLAVGARDRLAEVRGRLATPSGGEFRSAVAAVSALPADALLVAAPELAERLPAFTARHVAAALDRSTIVFSGSRERGEARLRARAALLAGDEDAAALAREAGVQPTHALFDPRAKDRPRCGAVNFSARTYALCELATADGAIGDGAAAMEIVAEPAPHVVADGSCAAPARGSRRDPWSAAAPVAHCRVDVPPGLRGRDDLYLTIDVVTGRATDELRITVRPPDASRASHHAAVRVSGDTSITLHVAPLEAGAIDVRIASSFLPMVKPTRVVLATR